MTAQRYKRLLDAVACIHRTQLAPEAWPEALAAISGCLDAGKAVAFRANLRNGEVHGLQAHNIDASALAEYAAYYYQLDPWFQGFNPASGPRSPFRCTDIIPDGSLRRTEYYNDFIKPLDMRFALSAVPLNSSEWMDVLSVFHGVHRENFDDESLRSFQVLAEHVAQALEVQRAIGRLHDLSRGLAASLDRIAQAVVLLASDGRLIHANVEAEQILCAGDGLSIVDNRVEAANPDARAAIDKMLHHAGEVVTREARFERRVVSVPRPSGGRPYVVRVAPVARDDNLADGNGGGRLPHAMMLIADPDAGRRVPTVGELRDAYKLTPAEATLAAAIAAGRTVAEIAADQDIAVDTARKRLKAVFEKTQTHRQAELIQRLTNDLG